MGGSWGRRTALLPIGGDKTGKNRWYEEYAPLADAIYDRHLRELDDDRTPGSKPGGSESRGD